MAYRSLYRKWRPQTLADIVGQEHVTQTLANAVKFDRITHAYLFCGPRGTGKTSTARVFSMMLNCQEGPTDQPCGECDSCRNIRSDHSVDVVEIDAASNRGVDEIRDLRSRISYAPSEGRYKVYIIDEVHMLTPEAFNALLKMLEEPPDHVLFILATTEPYKLLPTILSRCQRFDFRHLSVRDMVGRLQYVSEREGLEAREQALTLIARRADGALRDALGLLEQAASFAGDEITVDDVAQMIGAVDEDVLGELSRSIREGLTTRVLKVIGDLIDRGHEPRQIIEDLNEYYRSLMIVSTSDEPEEILELPASTIKNFEKEAGSYRLETIMYILDVLAGANSRLRYADHSRLLLEMTLVRLTRPEKFSEQDLAERISRLEERVMAGDKYVSPPSGGELAAASESENQTGDVEREEELGNSEPTDTASPPSSSEPPAETGTEDSLDGEQLFNELLELLKKERKIPLRALLIEAEKCRLEGKTLTLYYSSTYSIHRERVMKPENRNKIRESLAELTGEEFDFVARDAGESSTANEIGSGDDGGPIEEAGSERGLPREGEEQSPTQEVRREGKKKQDNQKETEELVEQVLELFGGRIIERIPEEE